MPLLSQARSTSIRSAVANGHNVHTLIASKLVVLVTHGTRMLPATTIIPGLATIWAANISKEPRLLATDRSGAEKLPRSSMLPRPPSASAHKLLTARKRRVPRP